MLNSKITTLTSSSRFDAHFGLRFGLRASTLALVLDESDDDHFQVGLQFNFRGISDFNRDLQSLL